MHSRINEEYVSLRKYLENKAVLQQPEPEVSLGGEPGINFLQKVILMRVIYSRYNCGA